jgi:MFS family permease
LLRLREFRVANDGSHDAAHRTCENAPVPASLDRDAAAGGAAGAAEVWDRDHRPLTIGLLLTVSFSAFEALAVTTVLPAAVAEIGGLAYYGWAFSGFVLASVIGISFAGHSADRRGAAPPFAVGTALFIAGLLGAGVASTMPLLVAARVLQGLGGGAISAVAYASVSRGYGSAARPRMIALLSTAWVVPGLAGPALAGAVADTLGWRWVFFGLALPTALAAAVAWSSLRRLGAITDGDVPAEAPGGDRRMFAFVLASGIGALLSGLDRPEEPSAVVVGAVGLILAVAAASRLLPAGSLRGRAGSPAAVGVMAVLGFSYFGTEAFVPLALTDVRGLGATLAGLPLTVAALAWTAGAWVHEREAPRRSHRVLLGAGLALIAAGIAGVTAILWPAVPAWATGVAWGVASFGMGLAYSTAALAILEGGGSSEAGEASAALQLANMLGIAVGTGLGGAVLDAVVQTGRPLATGLLAVDALMAAVALAGLALARRTPRGAGA